MYHANFLILFISFVASEHKTDVKTIAFDYCADSGYDKIEKQIKGHEIGILGMLISTQVSSFLAVNLSLITGLVYH